MAHKDAVYRSRVPGVSHTGVLSLGLLYLQKKNSWVQIYKKLEIHMIVWRQNDLLFVHLFYRTSVCTPILQDFCLYTYSTGLKSVHLFHRTSVCTPILQDFCLYTYSTGVLFLQSQLDSHIQYTCKHVQPSNWSTSFL